ncbi:ATP synthase F1 subunit epsilon [Gloeobacter violaceus]|uniref:ATP synthase epsilon chain n=1 Tax=Gloeobacter violaceus (strain ATCC 29082 / PCC 7421) TaxID=251221 RepID=ATPE_GLOVI|nr:ATP synthase F1 subunit epsilon [Gloeobacter violaceus]Q7NHG9.1 RecName: Full=ATP synthase epsilon chain; AltName: Full=ATP synthase F1 sector epsilon subunit; AltName: Full=F-ATPase epsilon subunit [Gloeobacter violaceus PCC 7421]BAC90509.1 ATP synthase epsilon subunit [Gloeobacter violaceus PCC 7421]
MALQIKIVAPNKVVFDDQVDEVVLPSVSGQLGILTNHAPLITGLSNGVMRVRKQGTFIPIAVLTGVAEVDNNEVSVVAMAAELGSGIDVDRARAALARAEQTLATSQNKTELLQAQTALERANARLRAAGAL